MKVAEENYTTIEHISNKIDGLKVYKTVINNDMNESQRKQLIAKLDDVIKFIKQYGDLV